MTEYESKDIEDITRKILSSADAHSEMELQIKVEHILRNFFESQGIGYEPRHNITVINGRPDTLYGHAIIEYKVPGTLNSKAKLKAAVVEAQRNISESATQNKEDPVKYIGIILDGYKITFTKFRKKWLVEPLSDISTDSVLRMLMYLRGLAKKTSSS